MHSWRGIVPQKAMVGSWHSNSDLTEIRGVSELWNPPLVASHTSNFISFYYRYKQCRPARLQIRAPRTMLLHPLIGRICEQICFKRTRSCSKMTQLWNTSCWCWNNKSSKRNESQNCDLRALHQLQAYRESLKNDQKHTIRLANLNMEGPETCMIFFLLLINLHLLLLLYYLVCKWTLLCLILLWV